MGLEYFPCYHSYGKKCEKLTDQELGRLFRALFKYSETGERQELAGRESIAFDFIADDIDRAKESYEVKCQKNRANASERKRTVANGSETSQNKDKDKDKDKDKEEEKKEFSPKPPKPKAERKFIPPTAREVAEYCEQSGYIVDAHRFVSWYTSNGWRVGKNPMKDWQAAVRTWALKDRQDSPRKQAPRDEDYYDEEAI